MRGHRQFATWANVAHAFRPDLVDDRPGTVRSAIVAHHDLVEGCSLVGDSRTQGCAKRVRPIPGRHDNREERPSGRPPPVPKLRSKVIEEPVDAWLQAVETDVAI